MAALFVAACGSEDRESTPRPDLQPEPPVAATPSLSTAADLFRATAAETKGNQVVGPQSIRTVLAMIHAGAGGRTATEMATVLHSTDADALRKEMSGTARALAERDGEGVRLDIAQGAWIDEEFEVKPGFRRTVVNDYRAELDQADFGNSREAERDINAWVADKTNDRITKLLDGQIDAWTRVVLVSATYLKARWKHEFEKQGTRPAPFTLPTGETVDVPMMGASEGNYRANEGDGWRAITLPYVGDDVAMTVVVPDDIGGFVAGIDGPRLSQVMTGGPERETEVYLPRFELRFDLMMNDTLKGLGMSTAFEPAQADFTAMADEPLYVSFVKHQAWIKVDEEGTEAAAATGGGMRAVSAPPRFSVDRPFVFVVHDRPTGEVLFIGRVLDPRQR